MEKNSSNNYDDQGLNQNPTPAPSGGEASEPSSTQNTSQMKISRVLAISDEDLRHQITSKNLAPRDWSWLKISDEDLR